MRVFINDGSTTGACDHLGSCRRRRRALLHARAPAAGEGQGEGQRQELPTQLPNDPGMVPPWDPSWAGTHAQAAAAELGEF